jgi:2-dehydro-3-deoxyphosphogluconate aldolase / (4S)-4-hydroxy-2-oxoglutarate aldolase
MESLNHILENQIVAIIRGAEPDTIIEVVQALKTGGIRTLEVTINSPEALKVIERLAAEFNNELLIGAGTVLDPQTAREALQAGAKFIISPTLNLETIATTRRYGAVSIPGAFTPTEILRAYEHGGDIIKVFPATLGPRYIREIRGPLSQVPLMPTGGISIENIREFREAGALAFGIGSSLVNTDQPVNDVYLRALIEKARKFTQALTASGE